MNAANSKGSNADVLGADMSRLGEGIDDTMRFGHAAALRDARGVLCNGSLPTRNGVGGADAASKLSSMPALTPRLVPSEGSNASLLGAGAASSRPRDHQDTIPRGAARHMVHADLFDASGWTREVDCE